MADLMFVFATISILSTSMASAQSSPARTFHGAYAGVDVGRQHLIGGALVDGIDTLQEDSRTVSSVFVGLRGQVKGFVLGGDIGFGLTNGDLVLNEPTRQLTVNYMGTSQRHWTLTTGYVIGARTLAYAYASEVTRSFDVTIRHRRDVVEQRDEQGMLRFGAGVEHRLAGPLRLRVTVGTSRADFSGRRTNVLVGRRLEASGGLVLQR